jgi:RNA polymerase sigma-70 factor (ECF subfamily)
MVQNPFRWFDFSARRRLEAMRPRLYRLAIAWCHDPHLADDLTQETLAKALARGAQLRDEQALEGWMFSILNNCWRDFLRGRRDFSDVDDLDEVVFDPSPGPEGLYATRQTTARVRIAIQSLPLAQRQVVTLVDIEECGYADVARILDVPVGTVMSRLSRARQALRSRLMADEAARGQPALRRVK